MVENKVNFKIIMAFIAGMILGICVWSRPLYIQNPQEYCAEYFEKYAC